MKSKELYDKRGRIVKQMKDLGERMKIDDFKFDPEVEKQFKGFNDELNAVDKQIEMIRKIDEVEGIHSESDDKLKETLKPHQSLEEKREKSKRAVINYMTKGPEMLNQEERSILKLKNNEIIIPWGRPGIYDGDGLDMTNFNDRAAFRNAQSTTATEGGDFIAEDFSKEIENKMAYYGPFANKQVCRVWNSATGADMPYPTVDDTSNTGALLSEAGDASSSVTDIVTAATTFGAYKYTSKLIKINKELEQDSYFDVIGFVADALSTRLGRALNTAFTTGTGSAQPQGAVVGASQGDSTASSTAITASEILRFLMTSIDVSYLNRPLTRIMMHQNMLYNIRALDVTTNNAPLWQPSFAAGVPDTLGGYQYSLNNDMASTLATGNDVLLFGDFSKFITRWVGPMRLVRLAERYAETDQTGVVAFQRVDSKVIQSGALKYLEMT